MCTVSWFITADGYELFFNRDEQKTRPTALAPVVFTQKKARYLMPVDPEGSGSWIATNNHGVSVCLLNYYQGVTPSPPLKSRGLLIKELAAYHDLNTIQTALSKIDLSYFAPFTLLIFGLTDTKINAVIAFQWNGQIFNTINAISPMASSAVDAERVIAQRHSIYQTLTVDAVDRQSLLSFHAYHHHSFEHISPCMHREDAHTVSTSHICVNKSNTHFHYYRGALCQHPDSSHHEIAHAVTADSPTYNQ